MILIQRTGRNNKRIAYGFEVLFLNKAGVDMLSEVPAFRRRFDNLRAWWRCWFG